MNELNKQLKASAVGYGLCAQWQGDWNCDKSKQELIDMYKRGLDFAIEHDYPSLEFIKDNFNDEILNSNLIFIDSEIDIDGKSGIYIINGSCSGIINLHTFNTATIYVRHNSNITIAANGVSKVFVKLYDNAVVNIIQEQASRVYVYKRSENCKLFTNGDVLIR